MFEFNNKKKIIIVVSIVSVILIGIISCIIISSFCFWGGESSEDFELEELKENDILPSVRTMAKELKISALTVKKAYDNLEAEGMTVTVHGKGTYVAASNTQLMEEERRKEVEADLEAAIQKGRRCGMKGEEIRSLFELIMEDE